MSDNYQRLKDKGLLHQDPNRSLPTRDIDAINSLSDEEVEQLERILGKIEGGVEADWWTRFWFI